VRGLQNTRNISSDFVIQAITILRGGWGREVSAGIPGDLGVDLARGRSDREHPAKSDRPKITFARFIGNPNLGILKAHIAHMANALHARGIARLGRPVLNI
jgi:hypothetical protein